MSSWWPQATQVKEVIRGSRNNPPNIEYPLQISVPPCMLKEGWARESTEVENTKTMYRSTGNREANMPKDRPGRQCDLHFAPHKPHSSYSRRHGRWRPPGSANWRACWQLSAPRPVLRIITIASCSEMSMHQLVNLSLREAALSWHDPVWNPLLTILPRWMHGPFHVHVIWQNAKDKSRKYTIFYH